MSFVDPIGDMITRIRNAQLRALIMLQFQVLNLEQKFWMFKTRRLYSKL